MLNNTRTYRIIYILTTSNILPWISVVCVICLCFTHCKIFHFLNIYTKERGSTLHFRKMGIFHINTNSYLYGDISTFQANKLRNDLYATVRRSPTLPQWYRQIISTLYFDTWNKIPAIFSKNYKEVKIGISLLP